MKKTIETDCIFSTKDNVEAFLRGLGQAEDGDGKEIDLRNFIDF